MHSSFLTGTAFPWSAVCFSEKEWFFLHGFCIIFEKDVHFTSSSELCCLDCTTVPCEAKLIGAWSFNRSEISESWTWIRLAELHGSLSSLQAPAAWASNPSPIETRSAHLGPAVSGSVPCRTRTHPMATQVLHSPDQHIRKQGAGKTEHPPDIKNFFQLVLVPEVHAIPYGLGPLILTTRGRGKSEPKAHKSNTVKISTSGISCGGDRRTLVSGSPGPNPPFPAPWTNQLKYWIWAWETCSGWPSPTLLAVHPAPERPHPALQVPSLTKRTSQSPYEHLGYVRGASSPMPAFIAVHCAVWKSDSEQNQSRRIFSSLIGNSNPGPPWFIQCSLVQGGPESWIMDSDQQKSESLSRAHTGLQLCRALRHSVGTQSTWSRLYSAGPTERSKLGNDVTQGLLQMPPA